MVETGTEKQFQVLAHTETIFSVPTVPTVPASTILHGQDYAGFSVRLFLL